MDHRGRLSNLQGLLSRHRLDGLLLTHLPNVRYLCGFTGSSAALFLTEEASVLFTDGRYTAQARAEVRAARVVIGRKSPLSSAAEWLKSSRGRSRRPWRMGIESDHLTVSSHAFLRRNLPSIFKLRPAPPLVEQARMIKDAEEVELLKAAVNLGAGLFDHALEFIRPGVREIEVAAEMEYAAMRAGAEAMSFPTIIASGERAALPHGRASSKVISGDGFVVCDFGVILGGYCSDMTRTLYVGHPSEDARQLYGAVRDAQQAAVEAVRPGRNVGEVDRAARKLLQWNKLGRYFTHSTGHGVGLEIHEAPRLASGQEEVLRPGMVITVEPGAYLPGKWGVRIEDMILITERGGEVLTPTSKELVTI